MENPSTNPGLKFSCFYILLLHVLLRVTFCVIIIESLKVRVPRH